MFKKIVLAVFLLGITALAGCQAAYRGAVGAEFYSSYPYRVEYIDPYDPYYIYGRPVYYYPGYFYDPYPYFFFGSSFFFHPRHFIIVDNLITRDPRLVRPGSRTLRGGQKGTGSSTPDRSEPGSRSLR